MTQEQLQAVELELREKEEKNWPRGKRIESTQTPFERLDENPGLYEGIKMLLGLLFLVPLRVICILNCIVMYYIVVRVYMCLRPSKKRPMRTLTRWTARTVLFLCGFHRIEVFGNSTIDPETHVIVSNHISFWEILYFMAAPCSPAFVFKKSCLNVPIIGKIALQVLGGIQVDNKNQNGGGASAIIERIRQMESSSNDRPLLIFPEGTTSNGSCLLSFRTGAFVAGASVQPILIQFPFKHFSPAYESIYTSVVIFRTLCQFNNRFQVRYLPVHVPTLAQKEDPTLYASVVRQEMAIAMDVPLCDANYKDKKAYHSRLAPRFTKHCLGWVSNFLYVKPKALKSETQDAPCSIYYGIEELEP